MNDTNSLREILGFIFYLFLYGYTALCLQMIAIKLKTKNSWFAWVPFVNLFLLAKMAGKSYAYGLLFFLPLINIIALFYFWWEIVVSGLKEPRWTYILFLIPGINFIVLGYLAFSK
jgi:hypothetical protein